MKRRRPIPHFSEAELRAERPHSCEQCGGVIVPGQIYSRDVFTGRGLSIPQRKKPFPDRIEVECRHVRPDCPRR